MERKITKWDLFIFEGLADKMEYNVPLSKHTTFRLGGKCPGMATCKSPQTLEDTVKAASIRKIPFLVIGSGSNILVSDKGVNRLVIRYLSERPEFQREGTEVEAGGCARLDDLVLFCAEQGLDGLNMATGIPGTVGGAVAGNAGAFGKQIGDLVRSVCIMDPSGNRIQCGPNDLGFGYRTSNLIKKNHIVVSARLILFSGDREALLRERKDILDMRARKHPNVNTHPCAGSIFCNVKDTLAFDPRQASGWFLEDAGVKSMKVGGARVYDKHANIIVRGKECSSQNVYELVCRMQKAVYDKHGLDLQREVHFLGEFDKTRIGTDKR